MHPEEGRRGPPQEAGPCLGGDTQLRPAPSWVFILYLLGTGAKEPCLGGAHFQPLPPSLPGHSTSSSLFLGHCDLGAGRIAEGQVQAGLRGEGAMVEAWGLQGLPRAPFCPPLQRMGVNSSGGFWGRWVGAPGGPRLPRPQLPLGSILLINTGSGTGLWLFSLAVEGGWGFSLCPHSVLPVPLYVA